MNNDKKPEEIVNLSSDQIVEIRAGAGRLSLLHTDAYRGTIRKQFGYRYAITVWSF